LSSDLKRTPISTNKQNGVKMTVMWGVQHQNVWKICMFRKGRVR